MAEKPLNKVRIRDFTGLVSNRGPFVTKGPGAATVQKNCRSISPGILEVRNGMRKVNFES